MVAFSAPHQFWFWLENTECVLVVGGGASFTFHPELEIPLTGSLLCQSQCEFLWCSSLLGDM